MADAWSTVVVRDSDYDDYTRSRVLALVKWESKQCPKCGNYDCLVPLPKDTRHVTWDQHGGKKFEVQQYRCLACGAADIITRDWAKDHEKDKSVKGQFAASDGRMFVARPLIEEV